VLCVIQEIQETHAHVRVSPVSCKTKSHQDKGDVHEERRQHTKQEFQVRWSCMCAENGEEMQTSDVTLIAHECLSRPRAVSRWLLEPIPKHPVHPNVSTPDQGK